MRNDTQGSSDSIQIYLLLIYSCIGRSCSRHLRVIFYDDIVVLLLEKRTARKQKYAEKKNGFFHNSIIDRYETMWQTTDSLVESTVLLQLFSAISTPC
jgi:hypothetical protein